MWTCPTCNSVFTKESQWHSCLRKDVDAHFVGRPDEFVLIFDAIVQHLDTLGPFHIRSVPSAIIFKRNASFGALKIQKSQVIVEWMTDRLIDDDPRISKTLQTTKTKWAHVIKVKSLTEIDTSILGYFSESYAVCK